MPQVSWTINWKPASHHQRLGLRAATAGRADSRQRSNASLTHEQSSACTQGTAADPDVMRVQVSAALLCAHPWLCRPRRRVPLLRSHLQLHQVTYSLSGGAVRTLLLLLRGRRLTELFLALNLKLQIADWHSCQAVPGGAVRTLHLLLHGSSQLWLSLQCSRCKTQAGKADKT